MLFGGRAKNHKYFLVDIFFVYEMLFAVVIIASNITCQKAQKTGGWCGKVMRS